eukprot:NODE_3385_length_1229_cov_17.521700_g3213_i0.p1 GENE.NODE_3385_length_1229_cov_17.521700_g3213_i0~~NODE_3385_length_1229_cov_17.521700_g3213_i0.p1  ORF type:complete len:349 (+),score=44.04 NODE_3385_length_1229_cov_17.521700_g3213_i0:78-1124(+)
MGAVPVTIVVFGVLLAFPVGFFIIRAFWKKEHKLYHRWIPPDQRSVAPKTILGEWSEFVRSKPKPDGAGCGKGNVSSTQSTVQAEDDHVHYYSDVVECAVRDIEERASLMGAPAFTDQPFDHELYIQIPTLTNCVVWYSFVFIVYGILSLITTYLGWRERHKDLADRLADIQCVFLRGLTLLLLGVQQRLTLPITRPDGQRELGQAILFLPLVVYSLFCYAMLFQFAPNVTLSASDVSWTLFAVLGVVGVFIISVLTHHILIAIKQSPRFMRIYIGALVVSVIFVASGMFLHGAKIHVHHYWWGWLLAHFCVFETKVSLAAQAACIAFFLHGTALWGCQALFDVTIAK